MAESGNSESVISTERALRFWLVIGSAAAVLFAVAAIAVTRGGVVAQFDVAVMASMSTLRDPVLTPVVQFITDLGSYYPVTLFSILLAFAVGLRMRRLLEPVVLLAAVEATSSLEEVFKPVTHRARPPLEGMLGAPVFDYSFPSGHTASSTALFVFAAVLLARTETRNSSRRLLVAAGCVLPGLIGLSRVYLGYHWLTDVVGAWLLALIFTSIGMVFITAHRRSQSDIVLRNAVVPRDLSSWLSAWWPVGDRPGELVRRSSDGVPNSVPVTRWPERLPPGPIERPAAHRGSQP